MYALKTFFIAQEKSYKAMKYISVQLAETVFKSYSAALYS